jgi:hypothetical protein
MTTMANHLKQMLLAGAAVLVALILAGVPLARAVPYAVSLACPLMMVWMMWMRAAATAVRTVSAGLLLTDVGELRLCQWSGRCG